MTQKMKQKKVFSMGRVTDKTITDIKIGLFFNVSPVTLTRWKKSEDVRLIARYKAYKEFYIRNKDTLF